MTISFNSLSTFRLAPPVTRREWRLVLMFALIVMAITTIPYLIGWLTQGSAWHFSGFLIGVEDGSSYLAKLREGARGDWLFHLVYTSEPTQGALLFTPYITLGKIGGLLAGGSDAALTPILIGLFHLFRIVGGVCAIAASYAFAALFLPVGRWRWLALVLITLGGGLGWLLIATGHDSLFGALPTEFYIPESTTFLSLYSLPHLVLARGALLAGLVCLIRAGDRPGLGWRPAITAGLLWIVVGLCVPFYLAVIDALLAAWLIAMLIRTRRVDPAWLRRAAIAALIAMPVLLYSLIVTLTNPAFAIFNAQNQLPSPNPLAYAIGYGVLAVPAAGGVRQLWRQGSSPATLLLPAWVSTALLLAYMPIGIQRRLLEGIIVPLSVLAVIGLGAWQAAESSPKRAQQANRRRRQAIAVVLALSLPSSGLILTLGILGATHPAAPEFQSIADLAAIDWLGVNAPPGSVVLSSLPLGNIIPARTGLRAFLGHGVETLHSRAKAEQVAAFFAGTITLAQLQTADQDPIGYVLYCADDADNGTPATRTIWSTGLKIIYDQGGCLIYQRK